MKFYNLTTQELIEQCDRQIAHSDEIINMAIKDGIIPRATSPIELNGQRLIREFFITNGIK